MNTGFDNGASKNGQYMVEVEDVHKAFEDKQVLDGVTCQIPAGKISVVMGPSGTGKSVLLRHIVGLLYPDRGDVRVAGKSVPKLTEDELLELRRNVGMLFQDGALFSSMNLYDNVAFPLRQHTRKSEQDIKEIVMQRLDEVGLADAVKKIFTGASGNTTVPMSRPSTTILPGPFAISRCSATSRVRTAATEDTADTAPVTWSPRISAETSSPARK